MSGVTSAADLLADQLATARPTSLWRDTIANILRQRNAVVGLTILTFFVLVAVFANQIAPHDPVAVLLGQEEGAKKLAGPCIHALGCPAAQGFLVAAPMPGGEILDWMSRRRG